MKSVADSRRSPRRVASLGTALLLVCAVSLQALSALCHCATCPTRPHEATAMAGQGGCCAVNEASYKDPEAPAAASARIVAVPCACGGAEHAQFTALASVVTPDNAAALQVSALEATAIGIPAPADYVALPQESPPPLHGLARLNQSFRC